MKYADKIKVVSFNLYTLIRLYIAINPKMGN